MLLPRPSEERIDRYTGPYERWVFTEELGRPFAFPAVDPPAATHIAAILDGPGDLGQMTGAEVRVPPLWPSNAGGHAITPFAFRNIAQDAPSDDGRIAKRLGELRLAPRVRVNLPLADASWVADYRPNDAAAGWVRPTTRPKAVIGVIDDALPFAHRAFLGTDGRTRISHLWLQSASATARPWDRVPFGREFVNGEIDALRATHGVDERRLYRACGAIDETLPEIGDVLVGRASHGAHILGLAAGNGPPIPEPTLGDDVAIVAVQLPNTIAWDTSGFGKEMFMLSALHYIFRRAGEIAAAWSLPQELPLVVNFSYGWSAGRHDGKSEMEVAIDELIRRRRVLQKATEVVLPTGNTFEARLHATFRAADFGNGPARIGWRLPPDDRTSSYLEIWLPEGFDPAGWEVRVVPPPGVALAAGDRISISADGALDPVGDPRRFVEIEIDGRNVGQLSADRNRNSRWRVMIAMIPTAETGHGRRLPAGLWRVEIDPGTGATLGGLQTVEIWVQRDDDPPALGMGGRQSRLEEDNGMPPSRRRRAAEEEPEIVTGFGSLSAIATAGLATRVAGYVDGTTDAAAYSSAASLRRNGDRLQPAPTVPGFAAPADQGFSRRGLPSIGVVSGSCARLVGTSAAAGLASRWMVANAAAGRPLKAGLVQLPDQSDVNERARQTARRGQGLVPIDLTPAGWSRPTR